MGLIFFIGINWLLILMIVGYVKKPAELRNAARDWVAHPIRNAFLFLWGTSILVAGWGILSGGRLSWLVTTPWGRIQSWQLGGILTFLGLGILFVASAYDGHQHRTRYERPSERDDA